MIDAIVQRLKDAVPTLKLIGTEVDVHASMLNNPRATPAAFVWELSEDPGPCETSIMQQRVEVVVGVSLVVRNVADANGTAARIGMKPLRLAVRDALGGWTPNADYDSLTLGPSQYLDFKDGYLWWQLSFRTAYFYRSIL